jgi:hypothetical protein
MLLYAAAMALATSKRSSPGRSDAIVDDETKIEMVERGQGKREKEKKGSNNNIRGK